MPSLSMASNCASYSENGVGGGIAGVATRLDIIKAVENTTNHRPSKPPRHTIGLRSTHLYIACCTPENWRPHRGRQEFSVLAIYWRRPLGRRTSRRVVTRRHLRLRHHRHFVANTRHVDDDHHVVVINWSIRKVSRRDHDRIGREARSPPRNRLRPRQTLVGITDRPPHPERRLRQTLIRIVDWP